ncbi:polysaccharide lyase 6 family protein [Phytoactinopolyspora limicola]|uniref:polysaccharide lyase 6 family protein n=1 Tax=Phytoactinopolyspora limicola TaxID=2715536 RepID=UPI00140CA28D|nr:polysaccharide lyase 6 family protein [Phytoactinopolyspora limicola]
MSNNERHLTRRTMLSGLGAAALGASILTPAVAGPARGLVGQTQAAEEYYVTTVAQLQAALAAALPGDSIVLQDRTWTDLHVVVSDEANHGLPGARITLRAETRGGAVLTGRSAINLARDYWVIDGLVFRDGYLPGGDRGVIYFGLPLSGGGHAEAHHCEVTHVTIEDYNPPNPAVQYNWVRMMGTNNTVSYSYFSGKNHYLDMVAAHWRKWTPAPTRHWIHHNYFGNIPYSGANGLGALTPVQGGTPLVSDFNIVEDNLFYRCDGESEIISIKSSNNIVRRNTVVDSVGHICLRLGNNNEVSSNYVFANGAMAEPAPWYPGGVPLGISGGVRISGEGHRVYNNYIHGVAGHGIYIQNGGESPTAGYQPVKDVEIVYNTIIDSGINAVTIGAGISRVTAGGDNVPPENLTLANNIIEGSNPGYLVEYGRWPWPDGEFQTEPVNLTFEGNIMYGSPAHADPVPDGIENVDPQLERVPGDYPLFRPAPTSPAIDAAAGRGYLYVNKDIEGRPRPRPRDVGAHEQSRGPVHNPPLTGADVGPSYLDLE